MTRNTFEPIPNAADSRLAYAPGPALDGFTQFYFKLDGIGHQIYHAGDRRYPPLLLM